MALIFFFAPWGACARGEGGLRRLAGRQPALARCAFPVRCVFFCALEHVRGVRPMRVERQPARSARARGARGDFDFPP